MKVESDLIIENIEKPVTMDNEQAKNLQNTKILSDKLDYASYLEFLSLGYNSLKTIGDGWKTTSNKDGIVIKHFININGYSQYIVSGSPNGRGEISYHNLIFLLEKVPDRWHSMELFESLDRELFNYGTYYEKVVSDKDKKSFAEFQYYIGNGAYENSIKEYKFNSENFIESIAEKGTSGYWNTSERIEKIDNSIMVFFRNDYEKREYYNIQADILLDCFLNVFVEKVFLMLNFRYITGKNQLDLYRTDYELLRDNKEHTPLITDILCNMTKRELAIMRNCLYANYDYNFKNEEWRKFFQKYYNIDYQGQLTEQEVQNIFSENEKWLLNMIIEIEGDL
jgi:hypothetical protein